MVTGVSKEGQGVVSIGVMELHRIDQHLLCILESLLEAWTGVPDVHKFDPWRKLLSPYGVQGLQHLRCTSELVCPGNLQAPEACSEIVQCSAKM